MRLSAGRTKPGRSYISTVPTDTMLFQCVLCVYHFSAKLFFYCFYIGTLMSSFGRPPHQLEHGTQNYRWSVRVQE